MLHYCFTKFRNNKLKIDKRWLNSHRTKSCQNASLCSMVKHTGRHYPMVTSLGTNNRAACLARDYFSPNNRTVGRSENPGVPVLFGGHNLPPLVEIGLTYQPKFGTPGTLRDDRPEQPISAWKMLYTTLTFTVPP